ncbi:outer membrane beta-barrel protein [Marinobacter confluentis]|nr:outer membrane beta-barrel protein [Marinobacter confluentis]
MHWPSLPLAFFIAPAAVTAAPPEVYVGFESRYSDNVELRANQEQSDLENTVFLRGNYQSDPGRCIAIIDGEIAYSIFAENTFDPETRINGGAFGRCELAQGLTWEVDNQVREVTRSSRQADTPDNRTRKNVFTTGPSYLWRLSPRDSVQFSTRYQNTEFSDPEDRDSDRYTGSVAWNHLFSRDLSAGLSSSISDVELDNGAEIQTTTVNTTFSKRWATTTLSGSVGVSEIETELNNIQQSSDGFVGDLALTRALDSSASVFLRASRELTDQTSNYDIQFDEFTFELTDSITVEVTSVETGLNKSFSNGDLLSVTGFASRTDSLDTAEQEDRSGIRTGYTRRVAPSLSAVANARYEYLSFESDQSDDEIVGLDLGLTYQAARNTELAAKVGRTERTSDIPNQEYEENWILLSIDYRFR